MSSSRRLVSLKDALFDAFANPDEYCDPQAEQYIWAVDEGLRRFRWHEWRRKKARKQRTCLRGCRINAGQLFYEMDVGLAWGKGLKLCAGCMAMVLYFAEAYNLPVCLWTHWDTASRKPIPQGRWQE